MEYEQIVVSERDGVRVITMNRPERLNAWTYRMSAEMTHAIKAANDDGDIIATVLTGAGRGFCAGADIDEVFASPREATDRSDADTGGWVDLLRSSKPIVAAVNGPAIGVGVTQILPMDAIVAAPGAQFSLRFVKLGLVPELASSQYLPARVGFGAASDLMLSGRTIWAHEARVIGLVDKLATPDDLLDVAHWTAVAMGENPQAALRMVKGLITENLAEPSVAEVQRRELEALDAAFKTPEHKEAVAAFVEKRAPDFKSARGAPADAVT